MDIQINNVDDMREFASYYVESCNNTPAEKEVFINFIKEADENQIATLLGKGVMEYDKSKINESFASDYMARLRVIKHFQGTGARNMAVAATVLPAAAVIAAVAYAATKAYKAYLSKAAKACNSKRGDEKKACMLKYKIDAINQKIANIQGAKKNCKNTKNPKMCEAKLDAKINKEKMAILKLQKKAKK